MKTVLFQGDSITDCGRNRTDLSCHGNGYAQRVSGILKVDYPYTYVTHNRGIGGNRVVDLYARIRKDMINLKPDYMSILIGVNDVWHEYSERNGVSAEKFEMVYDLMVRELKQELPELKLMIMEPFVLPGIASMNKEDPERWEFFRREVPLRAQAAKRIADKHYLVFVPLQEVFDKANEDAPEKDYWLRDGVHPTAAGHELITREWLKGFEKLK